MPPRRKPTTKKTPAVEAPNLCSHCRQLIEYKWDSRGARVACCGSRVCYEDCGPCPRMAEFRERITQHAREATETNDG